MTNDELKRKILAIVRGAMLEADELPFIETTDNIADALIAAGIGDVSELKNHRVVAEYSLIPEDGNVYVLPNTPIRVKQLYSGEEVEQIVKEREEYKHREEVAEKALDKAIKLFYEYRIESDVLSCSSCWIAEEAFKKCEARGLYKGCPQRWKEEILIQAEKELAEGRRENEG